MVDPCYEDSKNVRAVRGKENDVVQSHIVGIEDELVYTVHSITVMLQVIRRIRSATPAPANAASSALYKLEQC